MKIIKARHIGPVGSKQCQHSAGNTYVIQKIFNCFSAFKYTKRYKQYVYTAKMKRHMTYTKVANRKRHYVFCGFKCYNRNSDSNSHYIAVFCVKLFVNNNAYRAKYYKKTKPHKMRQIVKAKAQALGHINFRSKKHNFHLVHILTHFDKKVTKNLM